MNDILTRRLNSRPRSIAQGLTTDVFLGRSEATSFTQTLAIQRAPASPVHIHGDVFPARLQIGEQRSSRADRVEVVNLESDARFTCHSQQMQNSVGGASGRS